MARVAFIAHCLLNQNAKVEGGALTPAVWEPVIDLLREHDYTIRQMPCPEIAFGGARRYWGVREQFDTPLFRRHCRRLAKLVAAVMAQHVDADDDVVLIGIDSSPTMGVEYTCTSPTWGGKPDIGEDDSELERYTTAAARTAKQVRGSIYRSEFMRGMYGDESVLAFLRGLAQAPLEPHPVSHHAIHINYAPDELARNVDQWHRDVISFDYVLMVCDPRPMRR